MSSLAEIQNERDQIIREIHRNGGMQAAPGFAQKLVELNRRARALHAAGVTDEAHLSGMPNRNPNQGPPPGAHPTNHVEKQEDMSNLVQEAHAANEAMQDDKRTLTKSPGIGLDGKPLSNGMRPVSGELHMKDGKSLDPGFNDPNVGNVGQRPPQQNQSSRPPRSQTVSPGIRKDGTREDYTAVGKALANRMNKKNLHGESTEKQRDRNRKPKEGRGTKNGDRIER